MARNPMISLQGILLPPNDKDYHHRRELLTDFTEGKTFTHLLHGRETPCSKWDYAEGDMVKFRYDEHTKACFYRLTKKDLNGGV